jgi:cephalosporin-C deacetylase-like acetyl esterase
MPWGCNYAGKAVDRRLGGFQPDYVEALNYYDAVNHAKRITCQTIIVWAGLGDYTCPPSGVAVLYNNLAAPKRIHWYQGSTHGYIPPNVQRFLKEKK